MPYHPHGKTHKKGISAKKKKFLHILVSIAAVVSPAMTIPQVHLIYSTHNADGISIISWATYVVSSLIWLVYGFVHNEKQVIVNSIMGGILSACIVVGALMYQ